MATQIYTSSGFYTPTTGPAPYNEANNNLFALSDGAVLAFWEVTSTGDLMYAIRSPSGTWGTATLLLSGIANVSWLAPAVQEGDTLLWFGAGNNNTFGDPNRNKLQWVKLVYDAASHAVTSVTAGAITVTSNFGVAVDFIFGPIDATTGFEGYRVYAPMRGGGLSGGVTAFNWFDVATDLSSAIANFPSDAATAFGAYTSRGGNQAYTSADGMTIYLNGQVVATESGPIGALTLQIGKDGRVHVFWLRSGAIKTRSLLSTWSGITTLISTNAAGLYSAAMDQSSGDIWLLYRSTVNQANGEIWAARRGATTGSWSTPGALVAGGDAVGYWSATTAALALGGSVHVAYMQDIAAQPDLMAVALVNASAPDKPTVLSPVGNTAGNAPAMQASSVNQASNDPLGGKHWRVYRSFDNHLMWDSGLVSSTSPNMTYGVGSNTSDPDYHAPESLVYGQSYYAQTQQADQIMGALSPWSNSSTFVPQEAPAVTISSILNNGVTDPSSPTAIAASAATVAGVPTQNQGHAFDQAYVLVVRQSDSVAVVQSPIRIFSPAAASGSTITVDVDLASLVNGVAYNLFLVVHDAVTGVSASSTAWVLSVAWTPPPAAQNVQAIPDADEGWVSLAATDPGTAPYCRWEREINGEIETIYPIDRSVRGPKVLQLTDRPPPGFQVIYRLILIDGRGVETLPAEAVAFLHGAHHGKLTIWLGDAQEPELRKVALGFSTDIGTALGRDRIIDRQEVMPLGSDKPKVTFGTRHHWYMGSRTYILPASDGGVTFRESYETLVAMLDAGRPLRYRDLRGSDFIVTLDSLSDTVPFLQMGRPALAVTLSFGEVKSSIGSAVTVP